MSGSPLPVPARKPERLPLEPGELRTALRDSWRVMGIVGLRWRSLLRRAFVAKR